MGMFIPKKLGKTYEKLRLMPKMNNRLIKFLKLLLNNVFFRLHNLMTYVN